MSTQRLHGISGMVKRAADEFVVVHDTKGNTQPKVGTISVSGGAPAYQALTVEGWPPGADPANDLEGCCAVPGTPDDYLLVESGYYPAWGQYGRVIRVRVDPNAGTATYVGSCRPLPAPPGDSNTPKHAQLEGIACLRSGETVALLLAQRGDKLNPGSLIWGVVEDLDKPEPKFKEQGRHPLSANVIADRGAADLFARGTEGGWEVLSVASLDRSDSGPFRSSVYTAGHIKIDGGRVTFQPSKPEVLWDFEGLKVEALAAPADRLISSGSGMSIATDDEAYKGIWRPVLKSVGREAPSPLLLSSSFEKSKIDLLSLH